MLESGDETYLGYDIWLCEIVYAKKENRMKYIFKEVRMVFPDCSVGNIKVSDYERALNASAKLAPDFGWESAEIGIYFTYDTLINGRKELYMIYDVSDTTNQLPAISIRSNMMLREQRSFR